MASFYDKLFGGGKGNNKQKPTKPQQNTVEKKKLKLEESINNLDSKIKDFDDKEKKMQHKINIYKQKAKENLQDGKQKQAKKQAEEATRLQKQAENYNLRKKALVDKKFQLEQAIMDMDTIDALEDAQKQIESLNKNLDKLEDLIIAGRENQVEQEQINHMIKDLVNRQEEEEAVNDMLADLVIEMNQDKKKKVDGIKNVTVDVTRTKKQTVKKEQDDIAKMLAELG